MHLSSRPTINFPIHHNTETQPVYGYKSFVSYGRYICFFVGFLKQTLEKEEQWEIGDLAQTDKAPTNYVLYVIIERTLLFLSTNIPISIIYPNYLSFIKLIMAYFRKLDIFTSTCP